MLNSVNKREKISKKLPSKNYDLIATLIIFGIAIWCYDQVHEFDFTNIDDFVYTIENKNVRNGMSIKSIVWAFSNYDAAMWIPVTWLSLMADTSIFGRGPEGHHITNLVLHLFNTLLIFSLFSRLTGSKTQSTILAAVFAVHPLHVESVAWITERKDVLSTFFGLI